jgi:hypothetical protein
MVRFFATLRWWNVLSEFDARLSPLYLSLTGVGWVITGSVLLWGLFSGKRWTPQAILAAIFLWLTEYWVERLFFESPRANFSFALIASVVLLVAALISTLNRPTKNYFHKK